MKSLQPAARRSCFSARPRCARSRRRVRCTGSTRSRPRRSPLVTDALSKAGRMSGVDQRRDDRAVRAGQGSTCPDARRPCGALRLELRRHHRADRRSAEPRGQRSDDRRHGRSTRAPRGDRSRDRDRARRSPRRAGARRTRRQGSRSHHVPRRPWRRHAASAARIGDSARRVAARLGRHRQRHGGARSRCPRRSRRRNGRRGLRRDTQSRGRRHGAGARTVRGPSAAAARRVAAEWSELQPPRQRDSLGSLASPLRRASPARRRDLRRRDRRWQRRRGRCSIGPGSPS